jgi:hypothetical protein
VLRLSQVRAVADALFLAMHIYPDRVEIGPLKLRRDGDHVQGFDRLGDLLREIEANQGHNDAAHVGEEE